MPTKPHTDAEKPASKPVRSMTHPLRGASKGNTVAKRKAKNGEPFDPEDLSRRLYAHIAEQKLKAEKRSAARAAKEVAAQQDEIYHHVPRVAASAFERTTSPEVFRAVHKLAAPAMRARLEVLSLEDALPGQPATILKRTQALDQGMQENEMLRNRNQFQWVNGMAEAEALAHSDRDLYKPPQRTFESEFTFLRTRHGHAASRPLSTGDVVWFEEEVPAAIDQRIKHIYDPNDRNDWTQRDDLDSAAGKKDRSLARKRESRWMLMGRKDKLVKPGQEEVVKIHGSPPVGSKTVKTGFLARFKRHPS